MISAIVYDADTVERYTVDSEADLAAARNASGTTWIRVSSASRSEQRAVSEAFGLHPLELEDVRNDVRPKTEAHEAHAFVLVKTAALERGETTFEEEIRTQPIGVFLGDDWLVTLTVEDDRVPAVSAVWQSVENQEGRTLKQGPDFAAYRVIDHVVDDYFHLLDSVGDTIEPRGGDPLDARRGADRGAERGPARSAVVSEGGVADAGDRRCPGAGGYFGGA